MCQFSEPFIFSIQILIFLCHGHSKDMYDWMAGIDGLDGWHRWFGWAAHSFLFCVGTARDVQEHPGTMHSVGEWLR